MDLNYLKLLQTRNIDKGGREKSATENLTDLMCRYRQVLVMNNNTGERNSKTDNEQYSLETTYIISGWYHVENDVRERGRIKGRRDNSGENFILCIVFYVSMKKST